ncbi:type VI secretion system membrane subunit TssM [Litoribacillus peritrichatus]|uniref:Type VI secretion system membrane subunit TssM n=1 Tax=Litoribacillus peritrichatus TaxID=718191 RepID=A0ABP7MAU3_9GAMM
MSLKGFAKRTGSLFKSRWVVTTIGLIALAVLLWFGGPLVAIAGVEPLASPVVRLLIILLIAIGWGVSNMLTKARQKNRDKAAVNSLLNGDEDEQQDVIAKRDIEILRKRMQQALEILKSSSFSKGRDVNQLPWYMLIGPPGSGKTTALHNSGLEFPLKEKMGADSIEGIGGTRQCDWWFTNKAVLIDTAGRYTTQDSHSTQDSQAWQGFLGLLRKYRPQRPINGVLMFVSMADLLTQTRTERNIHARAIKQRVQELQNQLGMSFPVYIVFTKADLIAGFSEFFDDLSKEEMEQVWGMTFGVEAEDPEKGVVAEFNKEFHSIVQRLNQRLNSRLQFEHDLERRTLIYEFPKQLRLLQSAADDFLKEIFSPNAFEQSPMLRGVYIASATQEGVPIDRVMAQLGNGFGLSEPALRRQTGEGKGYFIKRLLEDVVFPEQSLASVNQFHEQKHRWIRQGALAVASVTSLVLLGSWFNSYQWNKALTDGSAEAISHYKEVSGGELSEDNDVVSLATALTILRDMPAGFTNQLPEDGPKNMGLYQGDKLGQPASSAYKRALDGYFTNYLVKALKTEMVVNADHRDYLYETLKSYLMLFQPEHFDSEQVKSWFALYFDRKLPGDINSDIRQELAEHLDNLLLQGFRAQMDRQSVADARELLMATPLAERAYQRLKREFTKSHIPDFRLNDVLGSDSLGVIRRTSGAPLHEGIPGLYTYKGFHGIFLVENGRIIKRLMEDSWVYGDELDFVNDEGSSSLADQVQEKYLRDYVYQWQELLNDIEVRPVTNVDQGLYITKILAGPEQPIQSIINGAKENMRLTKLPISDNAKAAGEVAGNAAEIAFSQKKSRLSRLLPDEMPQVDIDLPGKEVESVFKDYLKVEAAQLDEISVSMRKLYHYIEQLSAPGAMPSQAYVHQLNSKKGDELKTSLRRLKKDLPHPFADWLSNLSGQTTQIFAQGTKEHINEAWETIVLAEYLRAIKGKYPINKRSSKDVKLKDFEKFFGYGGTMDKFFNDYLAHFVNTRKSPWTFKRNIGLDSKVLDTFQRAQRIRKAFFEPGSRTLRIEFGLKPVFLDRHITHFMFEMDGQELSYRHGPTRTKQFVWPGERDQLQTRMIFTPPNGGLPVNTTFDGAWSWFRLLDDAAKNRPKTKKDKILHLALQGNNARIELQPNSVISPFWNKELEKFRCPMSL